MKVVKFGSSALSSAKQFQEVAEIICKNNKEKKIVVLSAMDGTTEELVEIADYLYKKNPDGAKELISSLEQSYLQLVDELFGSDKNKQKIRENIIEKFDSVRAYSKDIFTLFEEKRIVAQGAQLCSYLMGEYLSSKGFPSVNLSALSFMKIDKNEEPDVNYIKEQLSRLLTENADASLFITEGAICQNAYDEVDHLGLGGNDYTAALIGASVQAEEIEFWSDSVGIYTNNPNIVPTAKPVEKLSFEEAAELSYFLTRIIHPTCILPAKLANVPVRLMNIEQKEKKGTLISTSYAKGKIEAVASKDGITAILIKSSRMLFAHGFLRRIFEIFESYKTAIDMITTSEIGVSITIDNNKHLDDIVDDLKKFGTVTIHKDMTIISVIGDLPENNVGFQTNILCALKNLPIRMISYGGSSHNISFLIRTKDKSEALNALDKHLF
ncbi:MAG: aspartate kinase [Paludibacteraceae bacterium]|nr:aspartate kinase [Paludibacteraceae bacterium]